MIWYKNNVSNIKSKKVICNKHMKYSRTPEIETANLSQSHATRNLSQFRAYCLFHRNSSTAILRYLKLSESIVVFVTTLPNRKYWYFTLLRTFV